MQGLRDIKGIVDINDGSLLMLFGSSVVAVLIMIALLLYLRVGKKRVRRRFIKSEKELAKERIESIDYNDPKSVAYTFIEDVALFLDENDKSLYEKIVKQLEPYKYKKDVPPVSEELKKRIKEFIGGIKWQI